MKPYLVAVLVLSIIGIVVSLQAQPTGTGVVVGPTYYAAAYGVIADGTNRCPEFLSLLATVNVKGGSIVLDAGTTLLSSCNLTGTNSLGPNVFIVGRGAAYSNLGPPTFTPPPSILKMTCATGLACGSDIVHIECLTYGGQCGAVNLTVQDDTTSLPFFLYTGATPYLMNVSCWGKNNRAIGQQPVNDCVWLGNYSGTPPSYTCSITFYAGHVLHG